MSVTNIDSTSSATNAPNIKIVISDPQHKQASLKTNKQENSSSIIACSIRKLRERVDFTKREKRFILVGLDYECFICDNVKDVVSQIRKSHIARNQSEKKGEQLPLWVDIQDPSVEDMEVIEHVFHLHPLTTEDCLHGDTGEKWELFPKYMYIVCSQPDYNELDREPVLINIILMKNYVLTIHKEPIQGFDLIIKRLEVEFYFDFGKTMNTTSQKTQDGWHLEDLAPTGNKGLKSHETMKEEDFSLPFSPLEERKAEIPSSDWVLYAFLDALVDTTIPVVNSLFDEADRLDDFVSKLQANEAEDLLLRIAITKRRITSLRRILTPKETLIKYLISRDHYFITKSIQTYLRDVYDHVSTSIEKLDTSRESLNQSHTNCMEKVSLEIARASRRSDIFMSKMTVIATIVAPMSVISGLMGMNVTVPGQTNFDSSLYWFFGITVGLLIYALIVIILLRKQLGITKY